MTWRLNPFTGKLDMVGEGGGGASSWGQITGTISDQVDLQAELNNRVPYTEATRDLNLGGQHILTPTIDSRNSFLVSRFGFPSIDWLNRQLINDDVMPSLEWSSVGGIRIANQFFGGAFLDTSQIGASNQSFSFPNKSGTFAMLDDVIPMPAIWGQITGTISDQVDLQAELNNRVPYVGADRDLDLGEGGAMLRLGRSASIGVIAGHIDTLFIRNMMGGGIELKLDNLNELLTILEFPFVSGRVALANQITLVPNSLVLPSDANVSHLCIDATFENITVDLPSASDPMNIQTRTYTFKRIDNTNNLVRIRPMNGETIDREPYIDILFQNTSFGIISDGTNWLII